MKHITHTDFKFGHYWGDHVEFSTLKGKTFIKIEQGLGELFFIVSETEAYMMFHSQECCEDVYIESIVGDLDDLIGNPILIAEESTSDEAPSDVAREYAPESETWTFYKLATIKGHVDIRWHGSSNGYYSESVDLVRNT